VRTQLRNNPTGLDPHLWFYDPPELMRPVKRLTRLLALVQLFLVVPPVMSGSVCISADGVQRLESGCCTCIASSTCGTDVTLGATGTAECGPCRDELFTALKGVTPQTGSVTMAAHLVLTPCLSPSVSRVPERPRCSAGEPPGKRLPILRC
jgi:hypothetical protein